MRRRVGSGARRARRSRRPARGRRSAVAAGLSFAVWYGARRAARGGHPRRSWSRSAPGSPSAASSTSGSAGRSGFASSRRCYCCEPGATTPRAAPESYAAGPHPQLRDHRAHRPRQVDARRSHPRADRRRVRSARCASSSSTRWSSSASAGSRSRRRPCGSPWSGHELNLIDTPGHVDFTYEVSRSLQACEGALLVVDAAQGIEAQTLANAYLAIDGGLEIVPAANKIDLPQADPDGAAKELGDLLGEDPDRVLRISAKTGVGVPEVLDAIVERIPPPAGDPDAPPRALVFDSSYDQYRGVVAFVRVVDGGFSTREPLRAMAPGHASSTPRSSASCRPPRRPSSRSSAGEVGYVITGLKDVSRLRVGDTLTSRRRPAAEPLPGYQDVKPMVFAGIFPTDSDDYPELRDALERLKLNDASLFVRARDVAGARLRLPLRLPRPAAHGDRPRAARARVRPRPAHHRAERRLPGDDADRARSSRCTTRPRCRASSSRSRSRT